MQIIPRAPAAAVLALSLALGACVAQRADETAMVPTAIAPLPPGNPYRGAVSGVESTGGKETSPLLYSQIGDAEFKAALRSALLLAGAYSASGRYMLSAAIEDVRQPMFGADMTVEITVLYRLEDRSGTTRWERRIVSRHTAKFGEAMMGAERLRYAKEGAARENIASFLRALGAEARAGGVAGVS
ncbi:hypothetical protein BV509_12915 [Rhodovulum sulfidophilum]|uniref:LPS-assembly lipoprotein n=1 Tax=Rhodovulum visakhapatnamense TaxID=364297 RepID=A0ABS1RGP8_9RHOB|nr:hypothetical protein [Rhodovulum visakhapatnamense]MBL3570058.1 hypothetical protein [Rhodovulum visakhapatnamense]MBL3578324.1 hypothetical protein [Rhodovulum visakhapatnamense]OLS45156.1 hypothetical protein BV509_12915 [Rhodovulum sulfidophilum]